MYYPPVALMGSFKGFIISNTCQNLNLALNGSTSVWGLRYSSAVSDTSLCGWWIGHVPCGTYHLEYQRPLMISQSLKEGEGSGPDHLLQQVVLHCPSPCLHHLQRTFQRPETMAKRKFNRCASNYLLHLPPVFSYYSACQIAKQH